MPARRPLDSDLYADVVAEAKSRFDVWPSAYASGWVVRTYKERGGRYAGGDKKTRAGLTKWFGEEWVDLSRPIHDEDGQLVGYEPCGRKKSDDPAAYPKCRPLKEAMRMTPDEVKDAIRRKRMAEAKAVRGGRGGRGARAPVRVATYRANPMREPGDVPGFRFAVIEHEKPGAFKGRIILGAYTDDGQMLAWIAATPTTLRTAKAFAKDGQGVPRSSFPELTGYDDANVVWTVGRSHAWVDGWGPLLYEALLAFVVAQGYSGWVTSDTSATSKAARAVWRRFSERDDVEFRHDVGKNVNGESVDAMRALPNLLERRFPLLEQADKSAYPWRIKQLLDRGRIAEDGRFSVEGLVDADEARANPAIEPEAIISGDEAAAIERDNDSRGKQRGHNRAAAHEQVRSKGDHVLVRVPVGPDYLYADSDEPGYEDVGEKRTQEYAQLATEPPPIYITFGERSQRRGGTRAYVVNGNHRVRAARMQGRPTLLAMMPVADFQRWRSTLSTRANPRFTDIPNVIAVVDTADVHSYDDAYVFGRAATFDDELGVVGWHVTDDPDVVLDKIERGIDFKKAYGSKGQTSELGPGLYVSAVPHFWAARSTKKWAFVDTLGPEQRQAVLAALRAEIESDARRGRITEREAATAFRYLDTAEQTDDLRPLTILASLPYSIAWHKPSWLEDVGVVGAHPQAVKVALSGKFARLEHSYPSPDTLRALRRAGFAGAFTTGGAGANPELVVFHGASVTPLGIEDVE